jgi:hypothetical protein
MITVPYFTYMLQSFIVPLLSLLLAFQAWMLIRFVRRLVVAEFKIEVLAAVLVKLDGEQNLFEKAVAEMRKQQKPGAPGK